MVIDTQVIEINCMKFDTLVVKHAINIQSCIPILRQKYYVAWGKEGVS